MPIVPSLADDRQGLTCYEGDIVVLGNLAKSKYLHLEQDVEMSAIG